MNVLITGANGFVGRHLVAMLARRGHRVRAGVRGAGALTDVAGVETVVIGDLASTTWEKHLRGVDAVVHLAGIAHATGVADDDYDRVNRAATGALARAAAAARVRRLIFVSSIKAQSGAASEAVLTERDLPRPVDAYGRSKLAAEAEVAAAGAPFTILRPVLVYGAGVKGNLRTLVRVADLPLPLPLGRVHNRRSLLAIENLGAAIELSLVSPASENETFVVADPTPLSLAEIVAALRRGMGRPAWLLPVPEAWLRVPLERVGRGALWDRLGGSLVVDPSKLLAAGWQPQVGTAQGLAAIARR